MEKKTQYMANPCRASSIPYWKWISISVPENMKILHADDFCPSLLTEFWDEPYFRLKHDLQRVTSAVIPNGFTLCDASLPELADHINSCYDGSCVSVEELKGYTKRQVYCAELWVAIKDNATGKIVATGIAELDRSIGEGVLEWIQVSQEYRGRGLGCCIVSQLLQRMKIRANFATVAGKCNHPSNPERLYRKCGFAGNDIWHVLRKIL